MSDSLIKKAFLWNMLGSGMNAAMTMILTVVAAQVVGSEASGTLNLAFGLAFIFYCIGTFETRAYQVTDRNGRFGFNAYLSMRCLTCLVGIVCSLIYVFVLGYTGDKLQVVVSICLFKMCEALSDIFQGLFQSHDRMDLAGKTMFFHSLLATVVYAAVLLLTRSSAFGAVSMLAVSVVLVLVYDLRIARRFINRIRLRISMTSLRSIASECWTMAASSIMVIYVTNAEKLVIDQYMPPMQPVWTALFMPAAFINLFAQFAFKPMLTGMADTWNSGNKQVFRRTCSRLIGGIGVFSLIVIAAGCWLGIPLLEVLYGIPLREHTVSFAVILLGGGFNALGVFLWHVLIIIRRQRRAVIGDVVAFAFALLGVPLLVKAYGVIGAATGYLSCMALRTALFSMLIFMKAEDSITQETEGRVKE